MGPDERPDRVGCRPPVLPERPADRLPHEEVLVTGLETAHREQPLGIGRFAISELMEDRRPGDPEVLVPCPDFHLRAELGVPADQAPYDMGRERVHRVPPAVHHDQLPDPRERLGPELLRPPLQIVDRDVVQLAPRQRPQRLRIVEDGHSRERLPCSDIGLLELSTQRRRNPVERELIPEVGRHLLGGDGIRVRLEVAEQLATPDTFGNDEVHARSLRVDSTAIPNTLPQGRCLIGSGQIGPWRITGELGRGGSGVVHRAEHVDTGRSVALKVLHAHRTSDREELATLRREIDVLSALRHPGIVRIRDHGVDRGIPWLAMDLVEGESLRSRVDRPSAHTFELDFFDDPAHDDVPEPTMAAPLDEALLQVLGQLVHTVAWLHGQGVVHRDIKPENVLVVDGRAVLVDFGMAAIARTRDTPIERFGGTPGYMAPEQLRGEPVDARADLYSLGSLLYEMLSGRAPHPTHREPLADAGLEALIGPLLAQDPTDRRLERHRLADRFGVPSFGPEPQRALLRPPFVGRDGVASRLEALLAARTGSLLVSGEPGVGRSRIALEAQQRARRARIQVFTGRQVWRAVLSRVLDHPERHPEDAGSRAALAAAAEQLGLATTLPRPPELAGQAGHLRRLEGVRIAVEQLVDERPVLLLLDDLQAASSFEVDALYWVARSQRAHTRPLLLVATWSTNRPLPPVLDQSLADHLQLKPLTDLAMWELARSVWLEPRPYDQDRITVAIRDSAGNPLRLLEELRAAHTVYTAPFELRVRRRLQRLNGPARALVEAAVLALTTLERAGPGLRVDLDGLGAAVGLTGPALSLALHEARRAGFLDVLDSQVMFPQRRVLDVLADAGEIEEPERLHAALARHTRGALRAHHLELAGDRREALRAWNAEAKGAALETLRRSEAVVRLVELWEPDEDGPLPRKLGLERARIAVHRGEIVLARRLLEPLVGTTRPAHRAEALTVQASLAAPGSPEQRACHEAIGTIGRTIGDAGMELGSRGRVVVAEALAGTTTLLEGVHRLESLLVEAASRPAAGLAPVIAGLHLERGTLLLRAGRADAFAALGEALEGELPLSQQCRALGNRGAAAWEIGDLQSSIDLTLDNIRLAGSLGDLRSETTALSNLALTLSGMGNRTASHRLTGAVLARTLRYEEAILIVGPVLRYADDLLAWGDDAVQPLVQRCVRITERFGHPIWSREARVRLARSLAMRGELAAAASALEQLPAHGTRDHIGALRDTLHALRTGDPYAPTSREAALLLGLRARDDAQRRAAAESLVEAYRRVPLAVLHHWAVRFGATGLLTPSPAPPLPADVDSIGQPVEPLLPVVLDHLETSCP